MDSFARRSWPASRRCPTSCGQGQRVVNRETSEDLGDSTYPVLFRSIKLGTIARRYVHVQMSRSITDNRLWKLNRALCRWKRTIKRRAGNQNKHFTDHFSTESRINHRSSTLIQLHIKSSFFSTVPKPAKPSGWREIS